MARPKRTSGIRIALLSTIVLSTVTGLPATAAEPPFIQAAMRLSACFSRQAAVSESAGETALGFASRLYESCQMEIEELEGTASTPAERRRIRGAIRGSVTDAVLAFEARMAFRQNER
jgi:hypothetical protein